MTDMATAGRLGPPPGELEAGSDPAAIGGQEDVGLQRTFQACR